MKSWQRKLHSTKPAQVKVLDKSFAGHPIGSKMYIATPLIINEYIRAIGFGEAVSVADMRAQLAAKNHAEFTCPLTTGIFLRVAAEAAYEQLQNGESETSITPFWRVIEADADLAKKLSFDAQFIAQKRQQEKL